VSTRRLTPKGRSSRRYPLGTLRTFATLTRARRKHQTQMADEIRSRCSFDFDGGPRPSSPASIAVPMWPRPQKPTSIVLSATAPWLGWVFQGSGDLLRCLRRGRLATIEWREPASCDRLPALRSESPTGYSSAGCSPAEPASASPVTDNNSSIPIRRGNRMRR
jgi:hypothetical protein